MLGAGSQVTFSRPTVASRPEIKSIPVATLYVTQKDQPMILFSKTPKRLITGSRQLMKKILFLLFVLTALFCGRLPGMAAERTVVGISTPTDDHGWTGGVVWWAEQAVKDFGQKYPDLEFVFLASDSDKVQASHVESMLEKGVKALVILPHKPAPLTTVLNRVNQSGAFIVVVDRSIPKVPKDIYLSGDNYGFGKRSGDYMVEALKGQGRILVMEGIPCEGNSLRVDGFKNGIAGSPGIIVLDSQPAYWDPAKGYDLMLEYLWRFPEVDAVWIGDDDVLEGALAAYEESGRSDIKFFFGGGGSKRIIKRVIDGDPLVRATVTYPPKMIYEGVSLAVQHLKEGKTFPKEIVIPSELVTKENAAEHYYPDSIY